MANNNKILTHFKNKFEDRIEIEDEQPKTTNIETSVPKKETPSDGNLKPQSFNHKPFKLKTGGPHQQKTKRKTLLGNIFHDEKKVLNENDKTVYDDKTVYRDEDFSHVLHGKKFSTKVREATTPLLVHTDTDDIYKHLEKEKGNYPVSDTEVLKETPVVEKLEPKVEEVIKEMPNVEKQPTTINTSSPRTLSTLRKYFMGDIVGIIEDIMVARTNFEEFPIFPRIKGIDVIYGEEIKLTDDIKNNNYVIQTPTPKAIIYLIDNITTVAYKNGHDVKQIIKMIIETSRMSESFSEWLLLIKHLWIELMHQEKIQTP